MRIIQQSVCLSILKVSLKAILSGACFLAPLLVEAKDDGELIQECHGFKDKVSWAYCLTIEPNSKNPDVLYNFHSGGGLTEEAWLKDRLNAPIRNAWRTQSVDMPKVVTVSYGVTWLLAPQNTAPESGLFEHFMSVVLPRVEARLSEVQKGEIQRRLVLGRSMGGFNGAVIALQNPKLFAKVALLCPAIIPFHPYAAQKVVDDYILRNQLDSQLVFDWLVEFPKAFFDNTKSARAFYPLAKLKRGGQLGPTEFFLAVGNADQFGFMEGARLFSDLVAKKGGAVRFQQLTGGHCSFDAEDTAKFLAR